MFIGDNIEYLTLWDNISWVWEFGICPPIKFVVDELEFGKCAVFEPGFSLVHWLEVGVVKELV